MPNCKKWSLGAILATIMLIVAGGLTSGASSATVASASVAPTALSASNADSDQACTGEANESTPGTGGYTAPAPTKCDRPGTDQDGYYIPTYMYEHPEMGSGNYKVNDKPQASGFHLLAKGVSTVVVGTSYENASGTWTFNFTDTDIEGEAKNTYGIEVATTCKMGSHGVRYREAWWTFTNTLETDLPEGVTEGPEVHSIYPHVVSGSNAATDTRYKNHIADGETVRLPVLKAENFWPGLTPGTYQVTFWRADSGPHADIDTDYVVKRMKIVVPECDSGGNPGVSEAEGSLERMSCTRVKAVADARNYSATPTVKYKVIKRFKNRTVRKRTFAVDAGQLTSVVMMKHRHARTKVVLKVKQPGSRWVRLDRKVVGACR
jgi:hypothetical protein